MKICIAYPNKDLSYSETFIQNQLDLVKHDFELTGGRWPYLDKCRKTIFSFPLRINLLRALIKNYLPSLYQNIFTKSLANYLLRNKIEVLLCAYGPTGTTVYEACRLANTKLIVHYYGYDCSAYAIIEKYKELYIAMAQYACAIVVVAEDMKTELVKLGMEKEKIFNIPCGIDISKFAYSPPPTNTDNIVYVGRFTGKKSPLLTIESFNLVLQEFPTARLIMVGNGELWEKAKMFAKEIGVSDSIEFKGPLTPNALFEVYKSSRIFIQHSVRSIDGDSEGTPNSILEAAACGLPIVSTRHAGIKESVIHGKTGFLVDEGDGVDMAKYIIKLLNNPELGIEMGKSGREHIEMNYAVKEQTKKLSELLTHC